jgi:diacylglycerol kinase
VFPRLGRQESSIQANVFLEITIVLVTFAITTTTNEWVFMAFSGILFVTLSS